MVYNRVEGVSRTTIGTDARLLVVKMYSILACAHCLQYGWLLSHGSHPKLKHQPQLVWTYMGPPVVIYEDTGHFVFYRRGMRKFAYV